MDGLTWEQFVENINIIFEISNQLKDGWDLVKFNDDVGGKYLIKSHLNAIPDEKYEDETTEFNFTEDSNESVDNLQKHEKCQRLIKFEYHVLYHLSYAVPYLCFNAHDSNGTMLKLEDAWKIFNDPGSGGMIGNSLNMMNILTQMEHPILFKPFLTLHPCRIAELLHSLPDSKNKVLSFLSTYGPAIYLNFDLRYASLIDKQANNN